MNRIYIFALMALCVASFASAANAQIKVVKKPAQAGPDDTVVYDTWWVSWGLTNDKDYPMGIKRFSSEAEARSAAQAMINRTRGNGFWAITHVLIEGEPSVRSKGGPSLPSEDRVEKDA